MGRAVKIRVPEGLKESGAKERTETRVHEPKEFEGVEENGFKNAP